MVKITALNTDNSIVKYHEKDYITLQTWQETCMHIGTYHFGIMNLAVFEYGESKCYFYQTEYETKETSC